MGGILHSEDKDYKTAYLLHYIILYYRYSYFFEAFEAFNLLEDS